MEPNENIKQRMTDFQEALAKTFEEYKDLTDGIDYGILLIITLLYFGLLSSKDTTKELTLEENANDQS